MSSGYGPNVTPQGLQAWLEQEETRRQAEQDELEEYKSTSILRVSEERRSTVSVIGAEVTRHAMLGEAIQFGDEGTWHKLFPIDLVQRIMAIAEHSSPSGKMLPA